MLKYLTKENHLLSFLTLLVVIISNTLIMGIALVLNVLVDTIQQAIILGSSEPLKAIFISSMVYMLLVGLVLTIAQKLKASLSKKVTLQMRSSLMNASLKRSIISQKKENSAELLQVLNNDLETFKTQGIEGTYTLVDNIINVIAGVLMLIYINPLLALASLIATIIPMLIPAFFSKRMATNQEKIIDSSVSYNSLIKDIAQGYEIIKNYRSEKHYGKLHFDKATTLENSNQRMNKTLAHLIGISAAMQAGMQLCIMFLAGYASIQGIVGIGSIIAITQLSGQVIQPASELSSTKTKLEALKPILERFESILNNHDEINTNINFNNTKGININNLSLKLEDKQILKDINLSFHHGKKYAIVGESGSGKSTFLKCLAGYYDDYQGQISFGKEFKEDDLVLINQECFLFDSSIKENILMGSEYEEERFNEVLEKAQLNKLVASLPEGIETAVQENGSRFSGGERQRIALARALYHHKKLFLLDEVTSALDQENARLIEDAITSLEDTTCISITHTSDQEILNKYDLVLKFGA